MIKSLSLPLVLLLAGSPAMAWTWPWQEQKQNNPQADCALWKVRSDAWSEANESEEKWSKKALDHYLFLRSTSGEEASDKWWDKTDVSITDKGPDSYLAWMRWATKREAEADEQQNEVARLILERYFPYSRQEVQWMWDYRGGFGSKYLAWFKLPMDHPDRKKGTSWLVNQGLTKRFSEIRKFCKELTGKP